MNTLCRFAPAILCKWMHYHNIISKRLSIHFHTSRSDLFQLEHEYAFLSQLIWSSIAILSFCFFFPFMLSDSPQQLVHPAANSLIFLDNHLFKKREKEELFISTVDFCTDIIIRLTRTKD